MKTYVESNLGRVRTRNEDSAEVFVKEGLTLMVVADGMGGHQAGDIASHMALKCASIAFESFEASLSKQDAKRWLGKLFEQINVVVNEEAHKNVAYAGMGTTLVAALVHANYIILANVGDSRAYVTNTDNSLILVTEDHTLVAELYRQGEISEDELESHPNKNILLQAIGTEEAIVVDIFELEGGRPQKILLCSDGLTGMVDDESIQEILAKNESVDVLGRMLVDLANENGGKDNVSVILCDLEGGV